MTGFSRFGILDVLSTIAARIRLMVLLAIVEPLGGFWLIYMKDYSKIRAILIKRNKSIKQRQAVSKHFFHNLIGQKFNRLQVLGFLGRRTGGSLWQCLCDCGKITKVMANKLKSGKTKSCGCFNQNRITKHKMSNTRFYGLFKQLKSRCNNPKQATFHLYGGKGIKCLWESFEEFNNDMY